jgi:hypothetical protein
MKTKGRLRELIKIKIDKNVELTIKSIADFKYWKKVYPQASIVSYNIQTL